MRLSNGLELYRFRYKGSDRTAYVGVMAQEVQQIEPGAVWRDHNGYLMVNYDRIGLKFMTWKEWLARTSVRYQSAY
jgi:Chaperone of endosialidase